MNGIIYGALALELFIVASIDLQKKKISNWWLLLNLGMFLVFLFAFPANYQWDWSLLIFPLGFIVGGFILFLMNIMGAGDSKYLASLFLVIPLDHQFLYFERLISVTLVVGLLLLLRTIFTHLGNVKAYLVSQHWRGLLGLFRSRFSYAPVMFIAWILMGFTKWI